MNNYLEALEGMKKLLFIRENPLQYFNKKVYPKAFLQIYGEMVPTFQAVEDLYNSVGDPDSMLDNMAQALTETAVEYINRFDKKHKKDGALMDLSLIMASFIFPSIDKFKGNCSKPLTEHLLKAWKEAFPKSGLQASTYQNIEAGFHHRFCYVTTAVCETFGKPDDCYELTMFRNYRDSYLLAQQDGEEMIHRYYDVAPSIVKHINKREDSKQIYSEVYQDYLLPCLHMIEEGRNEECKDHYIRMVEDLQEKYFCS